MKSDETQRALWAVKEVAWQLYPKAFWKEGIIPLIESIETEVNTIMRKLGYDPTYIIK